jgi:hypothetical protein
MRNNMYGVASEYVAPTSAFSDSPCFRAICRRSVPSSISTAVVICCHVGDLRADFEPNSMAIAIRAVIDAAAGRLVDPAFDIDKYAREAVMIFDRATRTTGA